MGAGLLTRALRLRDEGEQDVTFLELFFDLVFVFAVTQLSGRLLVNLSFVGAAETLLLLLVVWWAWIYTTWMTNWFDPDSVPVRIVPISGMLASMLAIAIPDAFGDEALLFAGGYVGLQLVRNLFVVLAADTSEPLHAAFVRILVWNTWVGRSGSPERWRPTRREQRSGCWRSCSTTRARWRATGRLGWDAPGPVTGRSSPVTSRRGSTGSCVAGTALPALATWAIVVAILVPVVVVETVARVRGASLIA